MAEFANVTGETLQKDEYEHDLNSNSPDYPIVFIFVRIINLSQDLSENRFYFLYIHI